MFSGLIRSMSCVRIISKSPIRGMTVISAVRVNVAISNISMLSDIRIVRVVFVFV